MLDQLDIFHSEQPTQSSKEIQKTLTLKNVSDFSAMIKDKIAHIASPSDLENPEEQNEAFRIAQDEAQAIHCNPNKMDRLSDLLLAESIDTATQTLITQSQYEFGEPLTDQEYSLLYVYAAQKKKQQVKNNEIDSMHHLAMAHYDFLFRNQFLNYLRLVGILDPVDYDYLHSNDLYLFTQNEKHTLFSERIMAYSNGKERKSLIKNKEILTIGAGNGADEVFFSEQGAHSVNMVEGSPFMVQKLHTLHNTLSQALQKIFLPPDQAQDLFEALHEFQANGKQFDTIYLHSVLHYFDVQSFKDTIRLIRSCLKKGGHLAFAIKAPGAILDGNGIPLSADQEVIDTKRGRILHTYNRGYLNDDGQTRYFRDKSETTHLIETYLKTRYVSQIEVEDYETNYEDNGSTQRFNYFISKKTTET